MTTECLVFKKKDGRYGIVPTEHAVLWANDTGININNDPHEYIPYAMVTVLPSMDAALAKVIAMVAAAKPKEQTLAS
jgi:hypothetical protein